MKKWIPVWIKSPIVLFFQQIGRLPLRIIWQNMRWSFTQNRSCSDAVKEKVHLQLQQTVCEYLLQKYGSCMDEICAAGSVGCPAENSPIWVFWWQGEQNAPEIIKSCIMNIRKNGGDHPVRIVDSENYLRYVAIPDHILKKVQQKRISVTHLSDYLRMKLLAKHGGLWIDATVFVQKPIDGALFKAPIWTVRNPGDDAMNISNWEWSINFIGGWKGNLLFCTVAEVLDRYWKEHDLVAAYFMTDCLIRIIYDRHGEVRSMIASVPPSNGHYYYFQESFNTALDIAEYEEELAGETWLYKVSWKGKYQDQLSDGSETVYSQWKKDFGIKPLDGETL